MIMLTKLNDKQVVINCELIEQVEANPDTTITMSTGRKFIVRETVDDVVEKTIAYKRAAFKDLK